MFPSLSKQRRALTLICALWTLGIAGLYLFSARYRYLEWKARDQLARFGKRAELHPQIIFLAIDNASITLDLLMEDERKQSPALSLMQGGFPYPRSVYPFIIERLVQAKAKQGKIDEKVFAETRLRRGAYGQRYDNGQRHGMHVVSHTFW